MVGWAPRLDDGLIGVMRAEPADSEFCASGGDEAVAGPVGERVTDEVLRRPVGCASFGDKSRRGAPKVHPWRSLVCISVRQVHEIKARVIVVLLDVLGLNEVAAWACE
jgi:hypothetical protein